MAKDPAFLFYPGDYLRDTQTLSENAQVSYDRIMCEHMRNICITQQQLKFFTKRLTEDEVDELMFTLTKINGGYQIEWVAESISKRKAYSESRRKNRLKKDTNISLSYDEHMENENVYVINNINNKGIAKNILDLSVQIHNLNDDEKKDRGQAFYKTMVNDKSWQDLIKMSNKLTADYKLELKIASFIQEIVAGDDIFMNLSQLRKYFTKWIKKNK